MLRTAITPASLAGDVCVSTHGLPCTLRVLRRQQCDVPWSGL